MKKIGILLLSMLLTAAFLCSCDGTGVLDTTGTAESTLEESGSDTTGTVENEPNTDDDEPNTGGNTSEHIHTIDIDPAVAPTCVATGLTEGSHCSVCGEIFVLQTVIPATENHTYGTDGYCTVCSAKKPSEGLAYTSNGDGTCYVSGIGTCTDTDISIPPVSPEGDRVISVGECAFFGCNMKSIIIPKNVISIENYAFRACVDMVSITISESVTSIGEAAFGECSDLKSVIFAEDSQLTRIGRGAFSACDSLESITIPKGVIEINGETFFNCNKLIQKEHGVFYIDKWAIDCDTSLTEITLRNDTIGIGSGAFSDCNDLTSITIPESVIRIGSIAFSNCSKLTSITIPDSVQPSAVWRSTIAAV